MISVFSSNCFRKHFNNLISEKKQQTNTTICYSNKRVNYISEQAKRNTTAYTWQNKQSLICIVGDCDKPIACSSHLFSATDFSSKKNISLLLIFSKIIKNRFIIIFEIVWWVSVCKVFQIFASEHKTNKYLQKYLHIIESYSCIH